MAAALLRSVHHGTKGNGSMCVGLARPSEELPERKTACYW